MKKIVLLSDGTGNGAGKRNKTNVWRLYDALVLEEKDQIAMYSDGVGSQGFPILKLLGGAFGWGLKRNVIELYKYLCRNYESNSTKEESDKIYLFGFSRGAYTVRALAGLIAECGLFTDAVSERDLHEKAHHNYSVYRNRFRRRRGKRFNLFTRKPSRKIPHFTDQPKIEFIGVWDTVDAYGLPVDELMALWDKLIFPMRFPARRLDKVVLRACHAVSVDDERHTFHPVLWDESKQCDRDRIEQVWFPGIHKDVGGGYPRYELSLVSLDWMISKVEAKYSSSSGLHFISAKRNEYSQRSDRHGIQHDSRARFAAYYRYKPRNIKHLCNDPDAGNTGVRIDVPKIHSSVFERIRDGVVPYAPTGLPETYETVSNWGAVPDFENDHEKTLRCEAMNSALDIIFLRRWLYAAFLATTLMLVPSLCFIEWATCAHCSAVVGLLDPLFEAFKGILPKHASILIDAFRQYPLWFLFFLFLFLIECMLKRRAFAKTLARATAAWSVVKDSKPPPQWSLTITARLREISVGKACEMFRKAWWIIVSIFLVIVIFVVIDRVLFHVRDSAGLLCQPSSATIPATGRTSIKFSTENPCLPTKMALAAGSTYWFGVQTQMTWTDGEYRARPDGLEGCPSLTMCISTPLRRHVSRPWFELMGRVGHSGWETFVISSEACYTAQSDGELYLYVNDAVFGFLPDPYWALPYFWPKGKNRGTATVTVTPVKQSSACGQPSLCAGYCPDQ